MQKGGFWENHVVFCPIESAAHSLWSLQDLLENGVIRQIRLLMPIHCHSLYYYPKYCQESHLPAPLFRFYTGVMRRTGLWQSRLTEVHLLRSAYELYLCKFKWGCLMNFALDNYSFVADWVCTIIGRNEKNWFIQYFGEKQTANVKSGAGKWIVRTSVLKSHTVMLAFFLWQSPEIANISLQTSDSFQMYSIQATPASAGFKWCSITMNYSQRSYFFRMSADTMTPNSDTIDVNSSNAIYASARSSRMLIILHEDDG